MRYDILRYSGVIYEVNVFKMFSTQSLEENLVFYSCSWHRIYYVYISKGYQGAAQQTLVVTRGPQSVCCGCLMYKYLDRSF